MNLQQISDKFRVDARDVQKPSLFSDDQLTEWANEAQEEATIRARLIRETSASMCEFDITSGTMVYPLDPRWIEIDYANMINAGATGQMPWPLAITTQQAMDGISPFWRTVPNRPTGIILYDTTLMMNAMPNADYTVFVEGFRLPLQPMAAPEDTPEIAAIHHRHLVKWMLHKAFAVPDAETLDPAKSANALAEFEAVFGQRPDAANRKRENANVPHAVIPYC